MTDCFVISFRICHSPGESVSFATIYLKLHPLMHSNLLSRFIEQGSFCMLNTQGTVSLRREVFVSSILREQFHWAGSFLYARYSGSSLIQQGGFCIVQMIIVTCDLGFEVTSKRSVIFTSIAAHFTTQQVLPKYL